MTDWGKDTACFLQASELLPGPLRRAMQQLPQREARQVEEIRLRVGRPPAVTGPFGETIPESCRCAEVTPHDLEQVLEIATQASVHTALEQMRSGFISVRGGHRIGICGSAVLVNDRIKNLRCVSSLNIRVAHQVPGVSGEIRKQLLENGQLQSTLILSPPGGGKTTLLRDLIRAVSDGDGVPPLRVGVADERGELAGVYEGRPQLDIGARTDILDGCPKGTGLLMLLRGMNPQVLAADEITAPEDCAALETAANCGVVLLATAHGESIDDLRKRAVYRRILEQGIFQRLVTIRRTGHGRSYQVGKLEETLC